MIYPHYVVISFFIINRLIKLILKNASALPPTHPQKNPQKQGVTKNMPPCHFLKVNSNSNKEFIKITKKSRMFLKTGLVELVISFN